MAATHAGRSMAVGTLRGRGDGEDGSRDEARRARPSDDRDSRAACDCDDDLAIDDDRDSRVAYDCDDDLAIARGEARVTLDRARGAVRRLAQQPLAHARLEPML